MNLCFTFFISSVVASVLVDSSLDFLAVGCGLVFFVVGIGEEGFGFLILFTVKANKQREV